MSGLHLSDTNDLQRNEVDLAARRPAGIRTPAFEQSRQRQERQARIAVTVIRLVALAALLGLAVGLIVLMYPA